MSAADTAAPPLILASDGPIVILLDSGNREYHISRQTALYSGLFSDMLEDNDDDDAVPEIPAPIVDGPTMELVLEYMQHYASGEDTPTQLPAPLAGKIEDAVSDWEKGFLAKLADERVEADVIGAGRFRSDSCAPRLTHGSNLLFPPTLTPIANYLNIPSLLSLVSAAIARRYAGSPPEVWREIFGLPDDLSPEEVEKIEREYEVRMRTARGVFLCDGAHMISNPFSVSSNCNDPPRPSLQC